MYCTTHATKHKRINSQTLTLTLTDWVKHITYTRRTLCGWALFAEIVHCTQLLHIRVCCLLATQTARRTRFLHSNIVEVVLPLHLSAHPGPEHIIRWGLVALQMQSESVRIYMLAFKCWPLHACIHTKNPIVCVATLKAAQPRKYHTQHTALSILRRIITMTMLSLRRVASWQAQRNEHTRLSDIYGTLYGIRYIILEYKLYDDFSCARGNQTRQFLERASLSPSLTRRKPQMQTQMMRRGLCGMAVMMAVAMVSRT